MKIKILYGYLITMLVLAALSCDASATAQPSDSGGGITPSAPSGDSGAPQWGQQTRTTDCVASGGLEDRACTPGDIIPTANKDQICQPGYSSSVRNVPTSVKDKAYAEYGITQHSTGEYEVDHLVSLELGGSNDISNLWPEAASPQPGFHEKDKVENYLHDQVCNGSVPLDQAQREIAANWLAVYNQMPTK
jgi:hypothetical protein